MTQDSADTALVRFVTGETSSDVSLSRKRLHGATADLAFSTSGLHFVCDLTSVALTQGQRLYLSVDDCDALNESRRPFPAPVSAISVNRDEWIRLERVRPHFRQVIQERRRWGQMTVAD
jgi:hypothetical protein